MGAFTISRVRRSLLHFLLGKGFGAALGLLLLLLLVRVLSTPDYAFFIASLALLEVGAQLSSVGVLSAAQRYLPESLARGEGRLLQRLAWSLCGWRFASLLVVAGLIYVAADPLAAASGLGPYGAALRLYALVFVAESLARFLDLAFDSLLLQGFSQVSLLLRSAIRVVGVVVLSSSGTTQVDLHDWILIDALAAVTACIWGLVVLWWFLRREATHRPGGTARIDVRRYIGFALPSYVAASLYTLSSPSTVKLIAVRLLTTSGYAAFGFASALAATCQRYLPLFLLVGMIRPLFVAARQKPDYVERLPAMAGLVLKLNIFLLLPVGVFVLVAGESLGRLLSGGLYPEVGSLLPAFVLLLGAQAIRGVVSLMAQAMEDARGPLVGTTLGLLGLAVGMALASTLGGIGLCLGMVISEFLFVVVTLRSLKRHNMSLGIDRTGYLRMLTVTAGTAVVVFVSMQLIDVGTVIGLAAAGVLTFVGYFGAGFFWKPFAQAERDMVNRLLNRNIFVW